MAESARDPAIHALLLELATDLEQEADDLDRQPKERRAHPRIPVPGPLVRMRRLDHPGLAFLSLADLSEGGAGLRGTLGWPVGTPVELGFLDGSATLRGTIARIADRQVGVAFGTATAGSNTGQLVIALTSSEGAVREA